MSKTPIICRNGRFMKFKSIKINIFLCSFYWVDRPQGLFYMHGVLYQIACFIPGQFYAIPKILIYIFGNNQGDWVTEKKFDWWGIKSKLKRRGKHLYTLHRRENHLHTQNRYQPEIENWIDGKSELPKLLARRLYLHSWQGSRISEQDLYIYIYIYRYLCCLIYHHHLNKKINDAKVLVKRVFLVKQI